MDEIGATASENIIMQAGAAQYKPKHCEYFDFAGYNKMQELNRQARIIVSHAGVGSILTALELNKPMILVPRLKKYDEAYDDHQLEIAEMLSGHRNIKVLHDLSLLPDALTGNFQLSDSCRSNDLAKRLNAYLNGASAKS
jgi:UDP-N-acetylglucosamine transferase subunit ALG13